MKKKVCIVIGTRPEAIKMAPVVKALRLLSDVEVSLVSTGQHRELMTAALFTFGLHPDHDLAAMRPGQSLAQLTSRILAGLDVLFASNTPDLVMGHGDTASCFGAALCSFYRGLPFAHVEAGLRTKNLESPFPEEFLRQCVSKAAWFHFASSEQARGNLMREGIPEDLIAVTGNPGLEALTEVLDRKGSGLGPQGPEGILTIHRREKHGAALREVLEVVRDAILDHPSTRFLCPVHPSPAVGALTREILAPVGNICLTRPLDYAAFVSRLANTRVVVTDSGGVQEEAALLGRPVLLLREQSERTDGLEQGLVRLVGADGSGLRASLTTLLEEEAPRRAQRRTLTPSSAAIARLVHGRLLHQAGLR